MPETEIWDAPLDVPTDLEEERARLYYPIGCVGASTTEESNSAIDIVVNAYPPLVRLREKYKTGEVPLDLFVAHAHSLRVFCLDSERFIFRPCAPFVQFQGPSLVIGEPIEIEVIAERPDEVEENAGLVIAMCVAFNTPLVPETADSALALRQYVERFFKDGLPSPLPGRPRLRAGEGISANHTAAVFASLARHTDRLRTTLSSLPAEGDGVIEIPRHGSVLLLGADTTPTGYTRLTALFAELRNAGLRPLLVRDIPDLPGKNVLQKAAAIALACEHVLVDDTEPAGHLIEIAQLLIGSTTPFVVLRERGRHSTSMLQPLIRAYRWTQIVEYIDPTGAIACGMDAARMLSENRWRMTLGDEPWR